MLNMKWISRKTGGKRTRSLTHLRNAAIRRKDEAGEAAAVSLQESERESDILIDNSEEVQEKLWHDDMVSFFQSRAGGSLVKGRANIVLSRVKKLLEWTYRFKMSELLMDHYPWLKTLVTNYPELMGNFVDVSKLQYTLCL